MRTAHPQKMITACLAVLILAACGNGEQNRTVAATDDEDGDRFGICRMLTDEQVSSVLPGHDAGMVTANGGSLMKGVDAWQCSYSAALQNGDFGILTVIVNVASTDELYEDIKPTDWGHQGDEPIAVGDGGWVSNRTDDSLKVTVKKGRSVLDLDLMTTGAGDKSAQMVELARAISGKL